MERIARNPSSTILAASEILKGHRELVVMVEERFSEDEEDIEELCPIRAFSACSSS